ncbi:PREDICTED: uncharacterized protein LOC104607806 isoform X4 [Nelumbo nucifera]|uniref:YqgF/RNase H-like domain-containing protein n=2 Tax=Nelumbo nucifera TaxID=4432 RepID=A0A822ZCJ7_NELNU|nr:PREDICTED: uncharacterized protein LOC104607806 isoform X4 [Nelumbo nucifera]DAD42862.1 TPA_asm: hypothetical protein HUJ06_001092 [Nelumbo nucifera]
MESLPFPPLPPPASHPSFPTLSMNLISANLRTKVHFSYSIFRRFSVSSLELTSTHELVRSRSCRKRNLLNGVGVRAKVSDDELKERWLASLSCPFSEIARKPTDGGEEPANNSGSEWVIGIDPDVSGALALLKNDESDCSAQVFDTPHVQVLVGKRTRKRLDAKSIVLLLQSIHAPLGTSAYIEQSIPFPRDGKQDDSREAASTLFPSLSSLLKRKKDHGRAEALLIAAYGKGLRLNSDMYHSKLDGL